MDLYSIMCVSDRAKALQWYGVFFGRAADEVIGVEHLWQVGENAWVVVDDRDVRAERVGGAMITLGVTGLDDILARLLRTASTTNRWRPTATVCATSSCWTRTGTACRSPRRPRSRSRETRARPRARRSRVNGACKAST